MAGFIHRITSTESVRRDAMRLLDHDAVPYLTWVPEELRAQTIDPTTLPRSPTRKRRRILFMSSTYMTGGAEVMAVNAARALAPRHDVLLWVQRPGDYHIQGELPIYEGNPAQLVLDKRIDLVVFNNGAALRWSVPIKRETSAMTVLCLHGLVRWTMDQFVWSDRTIQAIDAVWAFSRVAGGLKHYGYPAPAYELHCPVDASRFQFTARRWRRPFRIGYVGRVSPEKNLRNLLRVWKSLRDRMGDDVRFHFVGGLDPTNRDPDYRNWLGPVLAAARTCPEWRELEEAGVLIDHGHCQPDEVERIVRNLHFLTLSSDFEGEPVVFTEAMASGCLCAYRNVGEVGQQLVGCGVLTRARSRAMDTAEIVEMADRIAETLSHPDLCRAMAKRGRARFDERHAFVPWAENFDRMMADILRRRT